MARSSPPMQDVRAPITLWLGLALIGVMHALLWLDVALRDGLIVPYDATVPELSKPGDPLALAARWAAVNMTPMCWIGYLLVADGLLTLLARYRGEPALSSVRARPNRLLVAWLTSIPVWCFFDWVNFHYLDAWRYHGLPEEFWRRAVGYFIAFAAIVPGMLLAAQLYQYLGLRRVRVCRQSDDGPGCLGRALAWLWVIVPPMLALAWVVLLLLEAEGWRGQRWMIAVSAVLFAAPWVLGLMLRLPIGAVSLATGAGMLGWVFIVRDPMANLALWLGVLYLVDPINRWMGQPSLLGDWLTGRLGRTLALMAGGLTCGLLWEFWNYWAVTKWTYHLPFLGPWEQVRYFEMPLPGLGGFLPFAAECWVMLQFIIGILALMRLRVAERLPDDDAVI